jgi:hypothetical protein
MKTKQEPPMGITVWGSPNEVFRSQYGAITYLEWCKLDMVRLGKAGRRVKLAEHDGEICIMAA